jgi:hypothetical protein
MKLLFCLLLILDVYPVLCDIKILNLPDSQRGPEPCARTCAGFTKYWGGWRSAGVRSYKTIDISECNFVTAPVVTVTIGGGNRDADYSPIRIWGVTSTRLSVLTLDRKSPDYVNRSVCYVHWIAVGFTC